jgi:hypothetical protein
MIVPRLRQKTKQAFKSDPSTHYNYHMEAESPDRNPFARNGIIRRPGKLRLKFVPSRARYYIKCPYFLYLSNAINIYISYPLLASRKGNFFEGIVMQKFSGGTGYEIRRANQVTDLLEAEGLYTLNKRADTEFYASGNVGLSVGILKPDLVLSEKTQEGMRITILEIKNVDCLMPYHYLQAYVYKLTLERLLAQTTLVPIQIGAKMIHLDKGFYSKGECEADFPIFRERLAGMNIDSVVVNSFVTPESESAFQTDLRRIASLKADTAECATCPGARNCDRSPRSSYR